MKQRLAIIPTLLVLLAVMVLPGASTVHAATAPTWTSIIHYFNPNPDPTNPPSGYQGEELNVIFFNNLTGDVRDLGTNLIRLRQYQSGKLLVGRTLGIKNFEGGAVISATVPIVAVYKQTVEGATPYSPVLYTSFDSGLAGSGKYFIPSVQHSVLFDTKIGIQNVESQKITITLNFYDQAGALAVVPPVQQIVDEQKSFVFKASDYLAEGFDGSLVIQAIVNDGLSTPAKMVAAAQEIQAGGRRAYAFEGMKEGITKLYMPSAPCEYGSNTQTATLDVQNTGSAPATIQAVFYDTNGVSVATYTPASSIPVGAKLSINACDDSIHDLTAGKNLVAVINASSSSIAAVGKVSSKDGLLTAFTGQVAPTEASSDGKYRTLVPYVEWSATSTGYRTYITVLNASGQAAQDVRAIYYTPDGRVSKAKTHTLASASNPLASNGFRSTNPSAARVIPRGTRGFLGAVIVESDQPLTVLVRVIRTTRVRNYTTLGDDYNGIPYVLSGQ